MDAQGGVILHYFDGRGKAELIRMMLCAGGIKFVEKNVQKLEDMDKLRDDGLLFFKALPLLQIDDRNLVQVNCIVHYVARRVGMHGENEDETTKIHMYYEGTRDFLMPFMGIGFQDEATCLKAAQENQLPRFLPIFNEILSGSTNGYLVGSKMSLADVALLEPLLATVEYFTDSALEEYPALKSFMDKMKSSENISYYLNSIRKPKNNSTYVNNVLTILRRK